MANARLLTSAPLARVLPQHSGGITLSDRFQFAPMPNRGGELTLTDHFAGGGGATTGAAMIPGLRVKMAANHWQTAIDVHHANHPMTDHAVVDLHKERPSFFATTDILWASPECTKWSQASGKQRPRIEEGLFADPNEDGVATRSRLLMFDVLRFAEYHRYRVMVIENVVDIATQTQYALAWAEWRRQLVALGYRFRVISLNSMHAQHYGMPAPQSRDRIYILCWLDGTPQPDIEPVLRPRAYCPKCDAMVEANQSWKNGKTVGRYRQTYVYVHGACGTIVEPGWLPASAAIDWTIQGERIGDRARPLSAKTLDRIAAGIARYWSPLAVPVEGRDGKDAYPLDMPHRTQTTRAETGLAYAPFLAELRGGSSDARSVLEPAATFTASGNHHALITRHYGIVGGDAGRHTTPADEPLRTLTANGGNMSLLTPYYGASDFAKPVSEPMGTLTTVDRYALVHRNNGGGAEMTTPIHEVMRTLTTAGHQSLVQAGPRGGKPEVTPRDLAQARAMIDDCYFRMLAPSEVARGMAFPDEYNWQPHDHRQISNRDIVKLAGNAVTPPCSRDILGRVVETWDTAAA